MNKVLMSAVGGLLALNLGGCGTSLVAVDPALPTTIRDQAQREMARPVLERSGEFETVVAEIDIAAPLVSVTKWFGDHSGPAFSSLLAGTDTVPGVLLTEPLAGTWNKPGDRRRIVFADKSSALEEITNRKPDLLQYQIWNMTSNLGRYISYAISGLEFTGTGQATHVRWTYSFRPKAWPDGYLIRSYVQNDFRQFMESGLAAMRTKAAIDLAAKGNARSS